MKIGLIGGGNIGRFLLQSINIDGILPDSRIVSILDPKEDAVSDLSTKFSAEGYTEFDLFIRSDIDFVIEAANLNVVLALAPSIIENGKDMLIISVGAFVDSAFFKQLQQLSEAKGTKIYLPSGAIGGLDVLKSANAIGQLAAVTITTRKPPAALSLGAIDEEQIIFEGTATKAIELFPQNVNVAIILSLAGLGSDKTMVKIIADPKVNKNIHCIEASGAFGKFTLQLENDPMPGNPKTSYLAALSILSTLKNNNEAIQIG